MKNHPYTTPVFPAPLAVMLILMLVLCTLPGLSLAGNHGTLQPVVWAADTAPTGSSDAGTSVTNTVQNGYENPFTQSANLAAAVYPDPGAPMANAAVAGHADLGPGGQIPFWMINGPHAQPHTGFGTPADFDPVDEAVVHPLRMPGWFAQEPDSRGFLDFNHIIGWHVDTTEPEKIWTARAAYASAVLVSDTGGDATLYFGGNSRIRVVLNGKLLFQSQADENAVRDARSVVLPLQPGENILLVRTTQSHMNHNIVVFEELSYDWGFYARVEPGEQTITIAMPQARPMSAELESTFFFREIDGVLHQRHDVVFSRYQRGKPARISLHLPGRTIEQEVEQFPYGRSRHALWVPAIEEPLRAGLELATGDSSRRWGVTLQPRPRYELHLMFLTHTDIGYTHTQPIVREIHMRILDEVIDLCLEDPDFRWTIETVWSLQAYYEGRSSERFQLLVDLMHEGRVALSPVYTNPFTGMVSREEFIRSVDMARYFREQYGLTYDAAVYNDVPGQSWFLPRLLHDSGVGFMVNGLNEVYGGYRLQQAIPKIMHWEGHDGTRILHYRTESYNEAMAYGLERDNAAVAHRMWQRIAKLEADGYPLDKILLNSAFGDNLGIPMRQWAAHRRWNEEYAWPRFIPATVSSFAKAIMDDAAVHELPVVRGDAVSDWDILYQGEPERMQRYRQTQHRLYTAENLAIMSALQHPGLRTMKHEIGRAYELQLQYSGHGSGLEYGYGSDDENERAFAYREGYVSEALNESMQALERAAFRTMDPFAALGGQYAVVLNPHAHAVDVPVELGLRPAWSEHYAVVDAVTGTCLPSVVTGHVLKFIAPDVPALGWKKFSLVPACEVGPEDGEVLAYGADSIENEALRVRVDRENGLVASVYDKVRGVELNVQGTGFAAPAVQQGRPDGAFHPVTAGQETAQITVIDERPYALHLQVSHAGALFTSFTYTLHPGSDVLTVEAEMDLRRLEETVGAEAMTEARAYAIRFPKPEASAAMHIETVGGFLGDPADRMPGMGSQAYSMQTALSAVGGSGRLDIASPDVRVVFTDDTGIYFNLANHFPENWNRREPNDRVITARFAVRHAEGGFQPGEIVRFGRMAASEAMVLRGWYTGEPAFWQGLQLSGRNTVLQALRALGDTAELGILIRLVNTHPGAADTVELTAPWLTAGRIYQTGLYGQDPRPIGPETEGRLLLELAPNETATLKWLPEP